VENQFLALIIDSGNPVRAEVATSKGKLLHMLLMSFFRLFLLNHAFDFLDLRVILTRLVIREQK
jgi:hypothetical protein